MRYNNLKSIKGAVLIASFFCLIFVGCKDDDTAAAPSCLNEYDLSPLLSNYADKVILPRYVEFTSEYDVLYTAGQSFLSSPSSTSLASFQANYRSTYISWQSVSAFDFGPAEEVFLLNTFNNYPLNEGKAYADALEGNVDFSSPDDYNKGFPLLDYFLFGLAADDEATVDSFLANDKLVIYTQAVLDDMKTKLSQTVTGWQTYKSTFVNSTGTKDGESVSLLVNAFNKNYEFIKRNKIGVPSGVLSLGFTNPKEVEGFHSALSLELVSAAVKSSRNLFVGEGTDGINGEGLDDILRSLNADKNGENLADVILQQYSEIETNLAKINGPLSTAVDQQKDEVIATYNSLTQQVIYIKSDMPSVMCIPITYVDNPSDSD
jgi:predicted lipoprotein